MFFSANAMITTPYDKYANVMNTTNKLHGTVGVGFGTTIQRNEDHYHLYVRDLVYPKIRDAKLKMIRQYYSEKLSKHPDFLREEMETFIKSCDEIIEFHSIVNNDLEMFAYMDYDFIFEGGQGIMLDMDYGYFPHVTRSNTTSKNAIELINRYGLQDYPITTYYVTRAYATRHGNGYLANEEMDNSFIKINPLETNVDTGTQGVFRRSILDLDTLVYAKKCDLFHNKHNINKLVVTCMDHVGDKIPIIIKNKLEYILPEELGRMLNVVETFISDSDTGFKL
jgi:adenylosuccinate synthase